MKDLTKELEIIQNNYWNEGLYECCTSTNFELDNDLIKIQHSKPMLIHTKLFHVISRSNYHVRDRDEDIAHGFVGIGYMPKYGLNKVNIVIFKCGEKVLVETVFKKKGLIKVLDDDVMLTKLKSTVTLKYPHPNCTMDSYYEAHCYVKICTNFDEAEPFLGKEDEGTEWKNIKDLDDTERAIVNCLT